MSAEQRARRERFGRQLAAWREQLEISQMELALRLERSQSYVSKWEVGGAAEFTPEELRAWSVALDVPMLDLLIAGEFVSRSDLVRQSDGANPPTDPAAAFAQLAALTDRFYQETEALRAELVRHARRPDEDRSQDAQQAGKGA